MKLNQNGEINLTIPFYVVAVLFVASLIFAIWAFSGRQNYKNNADQLVSSAVSLGDQQQLASDSKKFALEAEQPLIQYDGPEAYGSLIVNYPKTWSSYVGTSGSGGYPVDGYFFPGTLPSVNDSDSTNFALRVQVENTNYNNILTQYSQQQLAGTVTVAPYSLPKLPSVVGVKIVGKLLMGKQGTLVILPLRSEAVEIWTEGTQYLNDFNNNILPNLSFSP
jgi:hypothetical protein